MIIFIMLVTVISIGLLGILIVITYACVTTKSFHNFCPALFGRALPSPIKYAAEEEHAEQGRDSKDLDQEFHKSIEFQGDEVQLSASSDDDDDEAQMDDCGSRHCCSHHTRCDCTDEGDTTDEDFPDLHNTHAPNKDTNALVASSGGLAGIIV